MPMLMPICVSTVATLSSFLATWGDWLKLGLSAIGALTAILISHSFNRKLATQNSTLLGQLQSDLEKQKREHSTELANLNAHLNERVQSQLDRDRASHTESLNSKTKRIEYIESQIEKLYGPLAFQFELGLARLKRTYEIAHAAIHVPDGAQARINDTLDAKKKKAVSDTLFEHYKRARESVSTCTNLLQAHWGWLDEDDRPALAEFIKTANDNSIELEHPVENRLPSIFFEKTTMGDDTLIQPRMNLEPYVNRMRGKLSQKQQERSGLIAPPKPHEPPLEKPPKNSI